MGPKVNGSQLREQVIEAIGVQAAHAIQDGAVLAFVLTLAATYPPAAVVILTALGVDVKRPRKVLRLADQLVREEHARNNAEYFIFAGMIPGGIAGTAIGTAAAAVLPASSEVFAYVVG
jgi:hypothetical protein